MESRSEFRDRIGRLVIDDYEECTARERFHAQESAEAVYAAALGDTYQFFDGDEIAQEGIRAFAAERGITLED